MNTKTILIGAAIVALIVWSQKNAAASTSSAPVEGKNMQPDLWARVMGGSAGSSTDPVANWKAAGITGNGNTANGTKPGTANGGATVSAGGSSAFSEYGLAW